jgi:hypothetical protein
MQEGYTSKLENFGRPQGRGMGPEVFPLWLGGLRVGVILVDLPRAPRKRAQPSVDIPALAPPELLRELKNLLECGSPKQQFEAAKWIAENMKESA